MKRLLSNRNTPWCQSPTLIFVDAITSRDDRPIDHACLTSTRTDRLAVESGHSYLGMLAARGKRTRKTRSSPHSNPVTLVRPLQPGMVVLFGRLKPGYKTWD